jgi:lipid-binding SYLF domain-containing protein
MTPLSARDEQGVRKGVRRGPVSLRPPLIILCWDRILSNFRLDIARVGDTLNTMKTKSILLLSSMLATGFVGDALAADKKAELTTEVNEAKAALIKKDEGLKAVFEKAKGYVVFPSVAKGGLGVGAASGKGQLLEKDKVMGEAKLTQVSIGLQAGGQAYVEVILFEDQASLDNFKKGNFEFSAQVSAVAVTAGVSQNAKYEKGIMVLTMAKGGLMYEASVGGQKFKYEAY